MTAETATPKTAERFMIFFMEFPNQNYASSIQDIPNDTDPQKFSKDWLEKTKGHNKFHLISVEKIEPNKVVPFRIVWEDYEDENTQNYTIEIPVEKDPLIYTRNWLENLGDLGKYGFLISSIDRDGPAKIKH